MPELPERLGLDLPDALAGHREVLAHLFQGVLAAVGQPETQAQHAAAARHAGEMRLSRLTHGVCPTGWETGGTGYGAGGDTTATGRSPRGAAAAVAAGAGAAMLVAARAGRYKVLTSTTRRASTTAP